MKKSTKLLVLLLSVVLVCAGLVIAVSADAGTPGATYVDANGATQTAADLATAIANAKEGTTVTLTGDTTVSASIDVTKTITIDLNGYTLATTCNNVFKTDTNHKNFTIKGNGKITATGILINASKKNYTQNYAIEGDDKGIVITHDGTSNKNLIMAQSGNWKFTNLDIKSTDIGSSRLINTSDKGDNMHAIVNYEFNSVKINAVNKGTGITGTNTAAIVRVGARTTVTVNDCQWSANVSAFTFEKQDDAFDLDKDGSTADFMATGDFLTINNSYIKVSHGYTDNTTAADKKNNDEIGIFGAYGEIGGNIIVNNSYLSSSAKPIYLKHTYNGGAVILNNSVLSHNGTYKSQIARSANVVFNAGSVLDFANGNTNYMMSHNEGYKFTFKEGARLDADMYKSIFVSKYYADSTSKTGDVGQYEDETPLSSSTTYKFIYDPSGSAEYPYVVVPYSYTPEVSAPAYEYALTSGMDANATFWNAAGVRADVTTVNNNSYWGFVADGVKNSSGKVPEVLFQKASVTENAYDVVVIETDFAGDIYNGFSEFKATIQGNGGNSGMFIVKNDGTISYNYFTATENAPKKLSLGEWHRMSVVVDVKNSNRAYCYIDGIYVGNKALGRVLSGATGPRFSIDGVTDAGSSLFMDNVSVRGYGDGTGSALTDNGAKFLSVNGGKAVNKGIVASDTVKTALGYPVATLNDLPGVTVKLNRDIDLVQTITEDGVKIATNGYALKYTKDSLPTYITLDNEGNHTYYDFNTAHGSVSFKYFTGDYNDRDQITNPAYWTDVVTVKLGHSISAAYTGAEMTSIKDVVIDNHWYNLIPTGWSTEFGVLDATAEDILYPETYGSEVVALYRNYEKVLAYEFVILNADGSFNRGLSGIFSYGCAYGSGLKKVLLAYGETLVVQKDFGAQAQLNYIWNQGSKKADAENKTLSIDLNGHVVRVDANLNQTKEEYNGAYSNVVSVEKGETVNFYSSYPGAKFENYGVKNGAAVGGVLFNVSGGENVSENALATINANANGAETQHNTTLNVGTVTVNGTTIPGSNLTLEASVILNAYHGDSTCKINIDGVTAVKNAQDYTGLFVNRMYFGEINVTNSVIVNPFGTAIVDGHTEGIVDTDGNGSSDLTDTRALAKALFDNCTIILGKDEANVVYNNYSFESLTFKNCTTNGRFNGSKLKNVVVLGEGNAYFSTGVSNMSASVVKAKWNNAMTIAGANTITVNTISLNTEVDIKTTAWDYITTSYVIAINGYEGEADQILPVLPEKTVKADEALTVIFNNVDGTVNTKTVYANGGKMVSIPTPENYVGTIVTLTADGTYDKEVATVVTESVTYTPNFTAKANITGLKANLSLYANFNVNLYVPAEYKNAVTVSGYDFTEVNVNGVDYLQVTAAQLCSNAADAIVFTLNVSEAGYTAEATVTVSIVSYATSILEDSKATFTDSDKVLMCYMLDYANEAEAFFDGEANAAIENLLTTYAAYTAKYNYVQNYEDKKISNTNLSAAFNSASVSLESAPAFVLTLKDGFVGTVTVKYGENNVRTYNVTELTQREIVIEGMKVYNFGTYLEISVEGTIGGEQISITNGKYTLDTFAAYHLGNANDATSETQAASAKALKLISALSAYAEVAELYKTGALEAAINPAA